MQHLAYGPRYQEVVSAVNALAKKSWSGQKQKALAKELPSWLRDYAAVGSGDKSGLWIPADALKALDSRVQDALKLLRTVFSEVILFTKSGQETSKAWAHAFLVIGDKTAMAAVPKAPKGDDVAAGKLTIAGPPPKGPGPPYGVAAKRMGLGADVQAQPGQSETVAVGRGLTDGLTALEKLTKGPQGEPHTASAVVVGHVLPQTQREDGEPTPNQQFELLRICFGTIYNVVRSLFCFGGNDERPPLYVFESQRGGIFVKENRFLQATGLFVPVAGKALFDRFLKQQQEKHGDDLHIARLDFFVQFLIRSEQLPV